MFGVLMDALPDQGAGFAILLACPDGFEPSTDCLEGNFQPSRSKGFHGYDWLFNAWGRLGVTLKRALLEPSQPVAPVFLRIDRPLRRQSVFCLVGRRFRQTPPMPNKDRPVVDRRAPKNSVTGFTMCR